MLLDLSIKVNINNMKTLLNTNHNFDIVFRDFRIFNKDACMFLVDGYVKDESVSKLYQSFERVTDDKYLSNARVFAAHCIPYGDISLDDDMDNLAISILSGRIVIIIDGFDRAIVIDVRSYPQRQTAEPEKEKVMRGSKDGFVEALVLNCALLRRRIRSVKLCIDYTQIGKTSKTDVGICYLSDRVDQKLLKRVMTRIEKIKNTDALTMNQQSLADLLVGRSWMNPFPKFRYTERVDTACAQILEGDIIIIVDNAPSAMMLPLSFFDGMEEANDFYFPPITGSYLKLVRYFIVLVMTFATPFWYLFIQNPGIVPPPLQFVLIDTATNVPIIIQILLLEIMIDGLKLASLNTPSMMTTTMGIIGGIIVGDFAVESGWFSAEVLLYMAIIATATFTLPSYEVSFALKFMRIIILILTAIFNIWGFVAGVVISILFVVLNKTTAGFTYLYPLIPFDGKKLMQKFFRLKQE